ncbi:hypothetical protein [Paenibacillus sp. PL2-23]|uniref:hypothetical protein n=1 Tax=Paenibacillus sp. PL2-23 TaxID=2100729 RepID=UPI0030FA6740
MPRRTVGTAPNKSREGQERRLVFFGLILIAGDAYQTRGGVAVAEHMKLAFPFPAMATWNAAAALASARKLAVLGPSLLATGHGDMLPSPAAAMERAIGAAEAKLKKKGRLPYVT